MIRFYIFVIFSSMIFSFQIFAQYDVYELQERYNQLLTESVDLQNAALELEERLSSPSTSYVDYLNQQGTLISYQERIVAIQNELSEIEDQMISEPRECPVNDDFLAPHSPVVRHVAGAAPESDYLICQNRDAIVSEVRRITGMISGLANNSGVGIYIGGNITAGGGVRASGGVEALMIDNRVTLYCAVSAGVTAGAAVGVAVNGSAIRTFGCSTPDSYNGLALSASVSGAYPPVDLGISFYLAFDPMNMFTQANADAVYSHLTTRMQRMSQLRNDTMAIMTRARDYFLENLVPSDQRVDPMRTREFIFARLQTLQIEQGKSIPELIMETYLSSIHDRASDEYLLATRLWPSIRDSFGGCNSISIDVGAAAAVGVSGGFSISNYQSFSDPIDVSKISMMSIDTVQDSLELLCDPSVANAADLALSTGRLGINHARNLYKLAKAIALFPYNCR